MLVKFEQNHMVRNIQKFEVFGKKWLIIFEKVDAILEDISVTYIIIGCLKVHGPIFKIKFSVSLKNHHSKDVNSKFQLKRNYRLDLGKQFCLLQLPIPYCVQAIMVTTTGHVFINFFQTKQFLAVK